MRVSVPFLWVISNQRETSPPPLFSPDACDTNFELAILLKIVRISGSENSWGWHNSLEPGGSRCKLYPWGILGSYERGGLINFRGGLFDWKLKVLVSFLGVKSDRRKSPHTHLLFPKHIRSKLWDSYLR